VAAFFSMDSEVSGALYFEPMNDDILVDTLIDIIDSSGNMNIRIQTSFLLLVACFVLRNLRLKLAILSLVGLVGLTMLRRHSCRNGSTIAAKAFCASASRPVVHGGRFRQVPCIYWCDCVKLSQ